MHLFNDLIKVSFTQTQKNVFIWISMTNGRILVNKKMVKLIFEIHILEIIKLTITNENGNPKSKLVNGIQCMKPLWHP